MNRGQQWGGRLTAALGGCVLVLGMAALALPESADAALAGRVELPQAVPSLPQGTVQFGAAAADQTLQLDVTLNGQDAAGLAQALAAVSTPGSPDYRHYLTASQFASQFGPSAAEVDQVTSVLRSEGLTVGQPLQGSLLLPVSGSVGAVQSAFGTPLQSVQAPGEERAVVNTAAPSIPSSLSGLVTGVTGLNGLDQQHDMLKQAPGASTPASSGSAADEAPATGTGGTAQSHAAGAHAQTPQPCSGASGTAAQHPGAYTSTDFANIFGLNQMFAQGRTGVGQSIAVVEFEQYLNSDFTAFQSCYGLTNPIRNVAVNGGPGGPAAGGGEAALDVEVAAFNAPASAIVVYGAPNISDADALSLFQRIASDDSARVVTTSWGNCEQVVGSTDINAENGIFTQMALQGQTVVAASGDSGSEDCFPNNATFTQLAVDDPGTQPNVVSIGGTSMASASASSQSTWNDCQGQSISCADRIFQAANNDVGAGGGGYSAVWSRNPGQPLGAGPNTDPCGALVSTGCRTVPDIAYPADPAAGAVVAVYAGRWVGFGGTSVAAPSTAGFLSDTNQGCYFPVGKVGPALYESTNGSDYTDITSGNNDFTGSHSGQFAATTGLGLSDAATGLGTPVFANLALALQGGDGCPSVSGVSPNTGAPSGSGSITVFGAGFANASAVTFGAAGNGTIVARGANSITVIPPKVAGPRCVHIVVTNPQGISATSSSDQYGYGGDLNCGEGYRFVATDGGIFTYGSATFAGSMGGQPLNKPVVGMAATPSTNGYWEVATDGGIFAFGDAGFFGSMGGKPLNKPIVGIASTPDGQGYWEVASDGGIFAYGDAGFFGSMGGKPLNKPIVGIATNPNGGGYWMVATDGGIFDFGSAGFYGSAGSLPLNKPVVGMAPTPDGGGYWLVATDGGIFSYGDAPFFGSTGSIHLNAPIVGMSST